MKDGIIKADGTSRLMRATLPATYEAFRAAAAAGTLPLDVLFNESGWSQQPTFLNKATLLQDSTAALFGLGTEAVPDNAFSLLGRYNQHWWSRTSTQKTTLYREVQTPYTKNLMLGVNVPISYSSEIVIAEDCSVSLKDPQTFVIDYYTSTTPFKGNYILVGSTVYFALTSLYVYVNDDGDVTAFFSPREVNTVTAESYEVESGETELVHSSDRNAYPDSGEFDGFEYKYLGVPFENAVGALAIEAGSYVGTGVAGPNEKTSITFSFSPNLVAIYPSVDNLGIFAFAGNSTVGSYNGVVNNSYPMKEVSKNNNTVSFYAGTGSYSAAAAQFNTSGVTYNYFAIG